jgi:hypothetical protein
MATIMAYIVPAGKLKSLYGFTAKGRLNLERGGERE